MQSVDRAVRLLELLAAAPRGLPLTALARAAGLAVATAQGLLRTLQRNGLVAQAGRAAPYRLGARILRWARAPALARAWLEAARGPVERLCRETGEYVLLAERDGAGVRPLIEIRPDRPLTASEGGGAMAHLHTLATGKVLLAALPEREREALVATLRLERRGPRTLTRAADLRAELRRVRARGHAVCRAEASADLGALAVPVRDAAGVTRAALGLSVPLARFTKARERALRAAAHRVAEQLSALDAPEGGG